MRKILCIVVMALILSSSSCEHGQRADSLSETSNLINDYEGTSFDVDKAQKVRLPRGYRLLNAGSTDNGYYYVIQPMEPNYSPKTTYSIEYRSKKAYIVEYVESW